MFSVDVLEIDAVETAGAIEEAIREQVLGTLRRRGAVVGISGGIDSAVVAALCARALGPERVLGLLMPERHSSGDSVQLGRDVAVSVGVRCELEEIEPILAAAGCYRRQLQAIRRVFPDFEDGWGFRLVLPSILDSDRLPVFRLEIERSPGEREARRMPADAYRQLVAATNFKQRVRKMVEYYHADRLGYAVAGTPNRLEYDQGFFVKLGDGAADFKPIAHLYKTQVYQLAEELGLPEHVRARTPTTDTFPMPQTQEDFYFSLPYSKMDLCLWAFSHGVSATEAGRVVGLRREQVERVYADVDAKRRATRYLHYPPLLVESVLGNEPDAPHERRPGGDVVDD
jgi:NAD+ synthase